jgi:hypothetical protein
VDRSEPAFAALRADFFFPVFFAASFAIIMSTLSTTCIEDIP